MKMDKELADSLTTAVESGRADIIANLLSNYSTETNPDLFDRDALLNSDVNDDGTILHLASKLGRPDIVRTLLAAGADPGLRNKNGVSPFNCATMDKVLEVFNTELLQAVAQSNVVRVCEILDAGVDINLIDSAESQNTPLHWAASFADKEMIQCLCEHGANINVQNAQGSTALHDAVCRGDISIVEELISYGADSSIKAEFGKYAGLSALEMAKGTNMERIIELGGQSPITNVSTDDLASELNDLNMNKCNSPTELPAKILPIEQNTISSEKPRLSNSSLPNIVTDTRLHLLWPTPQKIIQREGKPFKPAENLKICIIPGPHSESVQQMKRIWESQRDYLKTLGYSLELSLHHASVKLDEPHIMCHINPRLVNKPEGYSLSVNNDVIKIVSHDLAGLYYAICTFSQMLVMCTKDDGIPSLKILDHPALPVRGVLLDLSKGRLPTVETLKSTIQLLATLKINQVHFYTRFTKPTNHGWQLPYSVMELVDLESFCTLLFITLIPVLDVCPTVAFNDIPELYYTFGEFLNAFPSSSYVNVGPRLSSFLLNTTEDDALFLDDAHRLLPLKADHTVQLCGFVFHGGIDTMPHLPLNMILMEYGFQADYNFSKYCKEYEESGLPFMVCPGTSAWNSLAGCPEAALSNVTGAIEAAVNHNALGMLLCNWSGIGHMTPQSISWSGYVVGAGLSWNSIIHQDFMHANLAELMNMHVFNDDNNKLGHVIVELGRAETYVLRCSKKQSENDVNNLPAELGSSLFRLLVHPNEVNLENLPADIFQKAMRHIRKCASELMSAHPKCIQNEAIIKELNITIDLMMFANRIGRALSNCGRNPCPSAGVAVINAGISNLPATAKTDLANRLLGLKEQFQLVWTLRQLPNGCQETITLLNMLLKLFIPDQEPHMTN
ncbi:uncharacterized protein LOC141906956 [Tubulanus polymorphus]|uniref:uncharacterized protein LOC141906956 n=1 Tax=Tubulanus polymorphus TaxID=672921 RepID=UPI003DA607E5